MAKNLSGVEERAVLRELAAREKRVASLGAAARPTEAELEACVRLRETLFKQQLAFFFPTGDKVCKRRVACTTRRGGKTTGDAVKLLDTATRLPRSTSLYVGMTSITARETLWPILKELVADFALPFEPLETTLTLRHKRSTGQILLKGADTVKEIEKRRGLKLPLAILDESGAFGKHIEDLVVSVIGPGLRDMGGELLLNGTPGYFPDGLFYEAQAGLRKNWEVHRWSLLDNPYLPDEAKDLDLICEEEGLTRDDPKFIREYLGKYVLNTHTQMFAFNPAVNRFTRGELPPMDTLTWYLGVDFGWNDETAIVACGFQPGVRKVWVAETWAESQQTSDDVAEQLVKFIGKYKPKRIIGDTGGYGKGVAMQIWKDYHIYVSQADKRQKLNHVEFMNSAFLRGELVVEASTTLASELPRVLWNEKRTDAHARAKDNQAMALLYAWRQIHDLTASWGGAKDADVDDLTGEIDVMKRKEMLEATVGSDTPWYARDEWQH